MSCEHHEEHVKNITANEGRSKSNTKRLDNLDEVFLEIKEMNKNIGDMNTNVAILSKEMIHQSKELKLVTDKLLVHDEQFVNVDRRLNNEENKEAKKALNDVNKLKWLVLASLVGSVITFISTLF